MTTRRSDVLVDEEASYHCMARCVRRAFLYGTDSYSGKNFDHRKNWVKERLIKLVSVFSIEALACAFMDNHLHVILRTRPDLLHKLSNKQIAVRWITLFPPRGILPEALDEHIRRLSDNSKRIKVLRKRLGNISWFMKSLNEFIARKANKEDDCKGRFWEGRFKCQRLCAEQALLGCAVYIDLNPIRAKQASTPEQSTFTSAYERIQARERGTPQEKLWLAPIQDTKDRRGFLTLTLEEYLEVLDETGRLMKKGKPGSIPAKIEPILKRLGIRPEGWGELTQVLGTNFSSHVGNRESLKRHAAAMGKCWLRGVSAAGRSFE